MLKMKMKMKMKMKALPRHIISCIVLLVCIAAPRLVAQQRSYIIPDVCAPGMGTYIEIIGDNTKLGQFGKDSIYANNPGDSVRVVLENPDDSTKVIIGPVTVAWNGRMIATHIFVLPSVQPNASYWKELQANFRIPIRVVVQGQTTRNELDTIYIVRPFTKLEDFSTPTSNPDSIVIGAVGSGMERRSVRSRRGAIVAESVTLQAGKKYTIANDDTDSSTIGNQGYLPFVLNVRRTFEGNGATIDVNAIGKNGGVGGGGGGGQVCDAFVLGSSNGNSVLQRGGAGFTGGAGGGLNRAGSGTTSFWANGGEGTGATFASPDLPGRGAEPTDGRFGLNGVPGGLSRNNSSDHPESTGGGTGHPFGRSGRGWLGFEQDVSAGGGNGRNQRNVGDGGGYGRGGLSPATGNGIGGGGEHGNIAVVPIAGGSGGASGNPQSPLGLCGGAGGGGGGAVRIAASSVRNVNLIARGAAGAGGAQSGTDGGAGSGGHIGVQSKLSVAGINADVRSGEDENSGAGRMRFDTPNRISEVRPLPGMSNYRFHGGATLDTTNQVFSPYTRPIIVKGFLGDRSTTRFYYRTTTGTWQQRDTVPVSDPTSPNINIPITFRSLFPVVRPQPLVAQDSLLFVVAAEQFSSERNPENPPYLINPKWVMSQAAANILRVLPLPLVQVGANSLKLEMTRCFGEVKTTTVTLTVRNARGGLLTVNNIRFEGSIAQFFSVTSPSFTVRQNESTQVTVSLTATNALRSDIENFSGRMLIEHNDTIPDVGGESRPSPYPIDLTVIVKTIRYDIRPSRDLGAITEITGGVIDFGRVAVGRMVPVRIIMNNFNTANRTPMRFETRAATQPITATPFSFEERSVPSVSGSTVIDVTFSPTMIGEATTQTVLIRATAQQGSQCAFDSTYRIVLRGTGIQPQLDTTRTTRSVELGALSVCAPTTTTSSFIVSVANSGNDTLVVRSIRMSSTTTTGTSSFVPSPTNLMLAAGERTSFTLRYTSPLTTQATANVRDTVLLETNDARFGASTPFRIPVSLTLRSVSASVRLIPPGSSLAFGAVRFFSSPKQTVMLANNGNVPVTVQLSMLRQPYRLVAPTQTRFTLASGATQDITIEMQPTDAQEPGVSVVDTLRFTTTPNEGQCPLSLAPLTITGVPQGPASMLATLWLDTLNDVNMRRDTTIRLWGRVQTAIPNRTDNLRAGFLVQRGMFFPKTITSRFGAASIEVNQPRGADRAVVVNVANVALTETPTVIAEILGTPILTDTMRTGFVWLPDSTRWARRDTIYFTDRLTDGFMAAFVPIISNQPRLTSGPVIGQLPRRLVLTGVQPNPVREGELTLTLNPSELGEYVVQIVNMLGERVVTRSWKQDAILDAKKDLTVASELVQLTLNVRGVASGAYLVRLLQPSGAVETFLFGIER
jgi:hypothetical protein